MSFSDDALDALKQNYTKIKWTDDYDFNIRAELDAADDVIGVDQHQAIELFEEIIKNHPMSARAQYSLARTWHILYQKSNETDERVQLCSQAIEMVRKILLQGNLKEMMRFSCANLMLTLSGERPCYSRESQIEALRVLANADPEVEMREFQK